MSHQIACGERDVPRLSQRGKLSQGSGIASSQVLVRNPQSSHLASYPNYTAIKFITHIRPYRYPSFSHLLKVWKPQDPSPPSVTQELSTPRALQAQALNLLSRNQQPLNLYPRFEGKPLKSWLQIQRRPHQAPHSYWRSSSRRSRQTKTFRG